MVHYFQELSSCLLLFGTCIFIVYVGISIVCVFMACCVCVDLAINNQYFGHGQSEKSDKSG